MVGGRDRAFGVVFVAIENKHHIQIGLLDELGSIRISAGDPVPVPYVLYKLGGDVAYGCNVKPFRHPGQNRDVNHLDRKSVV